MLSSRQARLTKAALETLSIVAYKQPVTRHQVSGIRGVNSDGVLRALADRGLIEEAGREETPGRPVLFATTPGFLERLGLPSLASLPSLAPLLDPAPEDDPVAAAVTDASVTESSGEPGDEAAEPGSARRRAERRGRGAPATRARSGGVRLAARLRGADRRSPGHDRRQGGDPRGQGRDRAIVGDGRRCRREPRPGRAHLRAAQAARGHHHDARPAGPARHPPVPAERRPACVPGRPPRPRFGRAAVAHERRRARQPAHAPPARGREGIPRRRWKASPPRSSSRACERASSSTTARAGGPGSHRGVVAGAWRRASW